MLTWRSLVGFEPSRYEKGGGSPPAPADYIGAAREQGAQNIEASRVGAALNRVNQVTPYGSTTYRRVGGNSGAPMNVLPMPESTPGQSVSASPVSNEQGPFGLPANWRNGGDSSSLSAALGRVVRGNSSSSQPYDPSQDQWEQVTQLSPEQQSIFNQQQGNQLALAQLAQNRTGQASSQVPLATYDPGDFGAQRDQVSDTIYKAGAKYLDPQFERRGESERARLLNSGNMEGSEGWKNAMTDFDQSRQSAYGDLRDRAIVAGGQEQSRLLADALRGRQQQVNERQIPLEEALALMSALGGGGNPQQPGAIPQVGGPQATPYLDAFGNQQAQAMNYYNAEQAQNAQATQTGLSIAGIAAMYF